VISFLQSLLRALVFLCAVFVHVHKCVCVCVCEYMCVFIYLFEFGCSLWLHCSSLRPTPGSLRTKGKAKGTIPDNMGEFEHEDDARGYKRREVDHAELKVRESMQKREKHMPSKQGTSSRIVTVLL
jgi:hypothetical protein